MNFVHEGFAELVEENGGEEAISNQFSDELHEMLDKLVVLNAEVTTTVADTMNMIIDELIE